MNPPLHDQTFRKVQLVMTELDALLVKRPNQQRLFTERHTSRDAAAKTSYVISHQIARNSKSFSDGEFVKVLMDKLLVGPGRTNMPGEKRDIEIVAIPLQLHCSVKGGGHHE